MNCSEIFTPVITDTGVCCSFNPHSNLRESNYSQLVLEMQATHLNIMQISVLSLFQAKSGALKNKETRMASAGIDMGLDLLVDQNSHRF